MTIRAQLHRAGGVTRTSVLTHAGVTRRELRLAEAEGWIVRPRRGWVAAHDADPLLLFAARHGVLLTCLTRARRLGLWVPERQSLHVASRHPHSHVHVEASAVHWAEPIVPRRPESLEDPVENALSVIAACQPAETAITVIDSALNRGLVTLASFQALPLPTRFSELLERCSPFADSGLESMLRVRLHWLGIPIRSQIWLLGHRVDFLLGRRLVVQIDGGHHVGAQRLSDNLHDARLRLEGYHVIRVGYVQVVRRWEEVQDLITAAVARGLHQSAPRS